MAVGRDEQRAFDAVERDQREQRPGLGRGQRLEREGRRQPSTRLPGGCSANHGGGTHDGLCARTYSCHSAFMTINGFVAHDARALRATRQGGARDRHRAGDGIGGQHHELRGICSATGSSSRPYRPLSCSSDPRPPRSSRSPAACSMWRTAWPPSPTAGGLHLEKSSINTSIDVTNIILQCTSLTGCRLLATANQALPNEVAEVVDVVTLDDEAGTITLTGRAIVGAPAALVLNTLFQTDVFVAGMELGIVRGTLHVRRGTRNRTRTCGRRGRLPRGSRWCRPTRDAPCPTASTGHRSTAAPATRRRRRRRT